MMTPEQIVIFMLFVVILSIVATVLDDKNRK